MDLIEKEMIEYRNKETEEIKEANIELIAYNLYEEQKDLSWIDYEEMKEEIIASIMNDLYWLQGNIEQQNARNLFLLLQRIYEK